jgi:hypothetical protein
MMTQVCLSPIIHISLQLSYLWSYLYSSARFVDFCNEIDEVWFSLYLMVACLLELLSVVKECVNELSAKCLFRTSFLFTELGLSVNLLPLMNRG